MGIKSGNPTIKRRHARNYIHQQADARLKEAVRPYQEQGLNALKVDSFEIKYYQQCRSTTICTCKQTTLLPEHRAIAPDSNIPATLMKPDSVVEESVTIDYSRPLFGAPSEMDLNDTVISPNDEFELEDDPEDGMAQPTIDTLFASSIDCGICYKTGYVPGYTAYGFERKVLTTFDIADTYGFHTDITAAPHRLNRFDEREGFVDFELEVPKYFRDVSISVRNNVDALPDSLYLADDSGALLTFGEIKANAGRRMLIRVRAEQFTHVVLEFDLGTEKLMANLAQMSKTVDWTLFDTLGNITMILPMTIANIQGNDVIYVPKRNSLFKVTDVTYLRTSDERNLDWSVTTRVLQPQESLGRIHKGFKLG